MRIIRKVSAVYRRRRRLLLALGAAYVVSMAGGLAVGWWTQSTGEPGAAEEAQYEAVEGIFGRFREPVREGDIAAIALCAVIILAINLTGAVMRTVGSVALVPIAFGLLLTGWQIGRFLPTLTGSSHLSVFLFVLMAALEWTGYVISAAAGANIGLGIILPQRFDTPSRWAAFKMSLREAGWMYVAIVAVLSVQAVFEILYVRKVLAMGGTGVPLGPY